MRLLESFPYWNSGDKVDAINACEYPIELLMDSGAFTAFSSKSVKEISLEAYMRWLAMAPYPIWRYIQLDVIGDPGATMRNLEIMYAEGFEPIPVWTRGATEEQLHRMYEMSDVVCLGGLPGTADRLRVLRYFEEVVKPKGYNTHWLGFDYVPYLYHYKPYSADASTSAVVPVRYGRVTLFDGNKKPVIIGRDSKITREVRRRLRLYDWDPREVQTTKFWASTKAECQHRVELGCRSWFNHAAHMWHDHNVRVFAVISTSMEKTVQIHSDAIKWVYDHSERLNIHV